MTGKNNRRVVFKSVFVCTSAIMSLWLGANFSASRVNADTETQQPKTVVVAQKAVSNNTQQQTPANRNQQATNQLQVAAIQSDNQADKKVVPQRQEIQDQTKVVIHYKGDGTKWVPYVWGKKPNSNGTQYKWDGQDENGYYATITLDKNYEQVGTLIKGVNDWSKDGSGQDRSLDVSDNGKAEVYYKQGSDKQQKVDPTYHHANIKLHYYGDNNVKSINYWTDSDTNKKTVEFTSNGTSLNAGFSIAQDFKKIFVAPVGEDELKREFTPLPGNGSTDIYLVKNDKEAYYTKSFALADQSLTSASMTAPNTIAIQAGRAITADNIKAKLHLTGGNTIANIEAVDPNDEGKSKKFIIQTTKEIDIFANNQIGLNNNYKAIDIGSYVRSKAFDDKYAYDGDDLGCTYRSNQTQIKLWAPTAKEVELNLYHSLDNSSLPSEVIKMTRGDRGVWTSILKGDNKGYAYDFKLTFGNGQVTHTDDPYSKAVTINGDRTVIEDYDHIKPSDFYRMPSFSKPTDAIVYETSIRDFTSDPNSGIKDKGKFLGMIESGRTPTGQVTGLDYLKSLGITHVQIMPSFDFASIDETKSLKDQYNWGYDPKNYDVPEGSYSTDPYNPTARIMEMKEMINGLHKAGIRVIMDVVYNHVYDPKKQAFELTVPGYYFHYDADNNPTGISGCGNDIASQRKMVRKYIIDSVSYWAKNYNIDGFRFDIMSLLDRETMNDVRAALNKIDPGIITYGEGWDMASYTKEVGTTQYTANQTPGVGFFNDDIRNAVKGEDNGAGGLVVGNGEEATFDTDAKRFTDSFLRADWLHYDSWEPHNYASPSQMIDYVACHDGKTLYDYLKSKLPNESDQMIAKRIRLANTMVMLGEGIPFFQSGQEGLRTKDDNANSYNSSIKINQIDWDRIGANKDSVNYFKRLTKLRKQLAVLRLNSFEKIRDITKVISFGRSNNDKGNIKGVFEYEYNVDGKKLLIVFNVNNRDITLNNIDLSKGKKLLDSTDSITLAKETVLAPLSALVVDESGNLVLPDVPKPDQPVQPTKPEQPTTPVQPSTPVQPTAPVQPTIPMNSGQQNQDINSNSENNTNDLTKNNINVNNTINSENIPVKGTNAPTNSIAKVLTHNAYIYNSKLQVKYRVGKKIVIKAGHTIQVLDNGKKHVISGKTFYRIGKDMFVKTVNTVNYYKLRHNSFVYDNIGKAVKRNGKRILLKKNRKVLLRSSKIIKINGKKFYQLKNGNFIKARNIVKVAKN